MVKHSSDCPPSATITAALRSILINTVGTFASRGRDQTHVTFDPKEIPADAATETTPAPADGAPRLADYTQSLLASQNALARLSIQLRTHKRYPADAMHDEAQALGATLRGALERLVDQTAPRLAVQSDPGSRSALLEEQVKALGRTLRREMPRALRRLRLAGKKTA